VNIEDLNPNQFPPGAHRFHFDIADGLGFPVLMMRGCRPGATLVASAAVHGDEYEGVRAIFETFETLKPEQMSGNFLAVPVLNGAAFWNGTRVSPLDGANLARVFPGDEHGTPSQRIAWAFANKILLHAQLYLDLHSAGIKYRMPSMAGYPTADRRARVAAEIFGADVIWGHPPPIDPGRTVSFANDRGIPWLYTEARGAGRIHREDLRMMKQGIRNLLGHLDILPDKPQVKPPAVRLHGNGNTDTGLTAAQPGFLLKEVEILQPVSAGDRLGRLVNTLGETLEEYHAPSDGIMAMVREFPVVQAGEVLFLLAELEI
jgi:predicted deacylase